MVSWYIPRVSCDALRGSYWNNDPILEESLSSVILRVCKSEQGLGKNTYLFSIRVNCCRWNSTVLLQHKLEKEQGIEQTSIWIFKFSRLKGNWRLTSYFFGIPSKCLGWHIETDTRCFVCLFVRFFAGKTVLNSASWGIPRKRFDFDHVTLRFTRVYIKQSKYGGQ